MCRGMLNKSCEVNGRIVLLRRCVVCRRVLTLEKRLRSCLIKGRSGNHTTLHQSVREWSEGLNVPEQVEGQRLEENQRWYVRYDGCRTNSLDGWKEVKVGCVYRDYPQCGSDAVPSAKETSIRYVASRPDAAHFGKELFALATHSGIYPEDINTQ